MLLSAMSYSLPSDEVMAIVVPIVVYWAYSGLYMMLDSLDAYRLHPRHDEDTKNSVSKQEVARVVLMQQLVQASVAFVMFAVRSDNISTTRNHQSTSTFLIVAQIFLGMFVVDAWQYFWHRYMHTNKFLYRHIHSWHHRLVVPYSFGSQYNHPVEGFLLDTLGGVLAFVISGMTPRTSIFFFSFCTMKGIDDHCGLWFPGNIFHIFFWNNTAYHDVHHQLYGNKYNFSQPFFVIWDKFFGTYMPYAIENREEGGLVARPKKL